MSPRDSSARVLLLPSVKSVFSSPVSVASVTYYPFKVFSRPSVVRVKRFVRMVGSTANLRMRSMLFQV